MRMVGSSLAVRRALVVVLVAGPISGLLFGPPRAQTTDERWWQRQPIRFLQTNLSETDSTVDPTALVAAVADFGANTFLMNLGGIVAQYPTRVPFHYPSAHLPAGRDLFGEVLREAHARQICVIGRFDLSKTQRPVFEAHPEWFFRRANGDPVVYNGLYSACINGGYYREHALTILAEALERYDVDDEGRVSRMEPHRVDLSLQLSGLLLQERAVRLQFVAAQTGRVARRIEPLDLQLQERVQIAAGVRGGDILHDAALPLALRRVGLQVRVQLLDQPPVDPAQRVLPQLLAAAGPLSAARPAFPCRAVCSAA